MNKNKHLKKYIKEKERHLSILKQPKDYPEFIKISTLLDCAKSIKKQGYCEISIYWGKPEKIYNIENVEILYKLIENSKI